ncbi:hypothetical protein KDH_47690 [Dictyobacter sp. S3.2.2.5]|uniref:Uncharacterized protein n=1 Tax=Dictyobacter halimunensis TaxID=3026934 RepID=A0ABQ6FXF7_9CHLR|nr:hypothetical protein KDH_47690 [Dictyobacter sp. S3.2.2.5]
MTCFIFSLSIYENDRIDQKKPTDCNQGKRSIRALSAIVPRDHGCYNDSGSNIKIE